ncbi:hypothetical protein GGS24DRAFT_502218 [Hypoxylon argillaceum]|nr:hypothetical protein GGS24DRAFT_502218 [Hypoxylon argillaceum]
MSPPPPHPLPGDLEDPEAGHELAELAIRVSNQPSAVSTYSVPSSLSTSGSHPASSQAPSQGPGTPSGEPPSQAPVASAAPSAPHSAAPFQASSRSQARAEPGEPGEEGGGLVRIVEIEERGVWLYVQRLDFSWYAAPLAMGITAVLIQNLSESYPQHKKIIVMNSLVHFLADLFIFTVITALTIVRYYRWPRLFRLMMNYPDQYVRIQLMPMALAPILLMSAKLARNSSGTLAVVWAIWVATLVLSLIVALLGPLLLALRVIKPGAHVTATIGNDLYPMLVGHRATTAVVVNSLVAVFGSAHLILLVILQIVEAPGRPPNGTIDMGRVSVVLTTVAEVGLASQKLGDQWLQFVKAFPPQLETYAAWDPIVKSWNIVGLAWGGILWCTYSAMLSYIPFRIMKHGDETVRLQASNFDLLIFQFSLGAFSILTSNIGVQLPRIDISAASTIFSVISITVFHIIIGRTLWQVGRGQGMALFTAPELTGTSNLRPLDVEPAAPWRKRLWSKIKPYLVEFVTLLSYIGPIHPNAYHVDVVHMDMVG